MKINKIIWLDFAKQDLFIIYSFISKDSNNRAENLLNEIKLEIDNLVIFPERGRIISELNLNNYRELIIKSYRVLYRIEKDTIFILSILHMSREFNFEVE